MGHRLKSPYRKGDENARENTMIRVVYRWTVDPQQADDFVAAWWEVTHHVQHARPGALGSTLLRSHIDRDVYLAVARWESLEAWQASRVSDGLVPADLIDRMTAATTAPASYEILDEVSDWDPARMGTLR
jgi:quinol monooxygenase YgiN